MLPLRQKPVHGVTMKLRVIWAESRYMIAKRGYLFGLADGALNEAIATT